MRRSNASAILASVHAGPSASAFSSICARRTFCDEPDNVLITAVSVRRSAARYTSSAWSDPPWIEPSWLMDELSETPSYLRDDALVVNKYVSVRQYAAAYGVSIATVYGMCAAGKLSHVRL